MRGTFGARLDELAAHVGDGHLVGAVSFEGLPYIVAHHEAVGAQHPPSWDDKTSLDYTRPGTGPKFLEAPLLERHASYLQALADHALEERGLRSEMVDAMRDLKTEARRRVPRDEGDLRDAAIAVVRDDGVQVYRRRGQ